METKHEPIIDFSELEERYKKGIELLKSISRFITNGPKGATLYRLLKAGLSDRAPELVDILTKLRVGARSRTRVKFVDEYLVVLTKERFQDWRGMRGLKLVVVGYDESTGRYFATVVPFFVVRREVEEFVKGLSIHQRDDLAMSLEKKYVRFYQTLRYYSANTILEILAGDYRYPIYSPFSAPYPIVMFEAMLKSGEDVRNILNFDKHIWEVTDLKSAIKKRIRVQGDLNIFPIEIYADTGRLLEKIRRIRILELAEAIWDGLAIKLIHFVGEEKNLLAKAISLIPIDDVRKIGWIANRYKMREAMRRFLTELEQEFMDDKHHFAPFLEENKDFVMAEFRRLAEAYYLHIIPTIVKLLYDGRKVAKKIWQVYTLYGFPDEIDIGDTVTHVTTISHLDIPFESIIHNHFWVKSLASMLDLDWWALKYSEHPVIIQKRKGFLKIIRLIKQYIAYFRRQYKQLHVSLKRKFHWAWIPQIDDFSTFYVMGIRRRDEILQKWIMETDSISEIARITLLRSIQSLNNDMEPNSTDIDLAIRNLKNLAPFFEVARGFMVYLALKLATKLCEKEDVLYNMSMREKRYVLDMRRFISNNPHKIEISAVKLETIRFVKSGILREREFMSIDDHRAQNLFLTLRPQIIRVSHPEHGERFVYLPPGLYVFAFM